MTVALANIFFMTKIEKKVLSTRAQLNRLFGRGIMTTFSVCRAQPNT